MMWKSLSGMVWVEIKCADIAQMIERLAKWNITVMDMLYLDDLTVSLRVSRADYKCLRIALQGSGCKITTIGRKGIYWTLKGLLRRPVFAIGVLMYILFVIAVPGRIFFVQIEGNSIVPDRLILETAQQCGIGFGANRREVRSEKMKNALLEKIPQLQWAGVNTHGCVAVISVRERQEEKKENRVSMGSVVATRDAIVRQITVLRGTQLCKVGQAVKAGEMLVSAYKDYGISIKLTGTNAEIYGQTERKLEAITPTLSTVRTRESGRERKYSLLIGKKQINFFKDSGISNTSCVKMYEKTYLSLPGDFTLPIALVTYDFLYYETKTQEVTDFTFLTEVAQGYVISQMDSGTILREESTLEQMDDICHFSASYSCYERIGMTIDEEFIKQNG